MAKRIPKSEVPLELGKKFKPSELQSFCEVYIPKSSGVFTYGIPLAHTEIARGSLVWVQLATRKKPALAIVARLVKAPSFNVRQVFPHASGFIFSERYMETLEWVSRYYISTPMKSLDVFWPQEIEKIFDAYAFFKNEKNPIPEISAYSESSKLTAEQENALNILKANLMQTGFRGVLLHGVTGSGKTRVYQELAREAILQKKKVLVLVPEIGLTPQTSKRFEDFLKIPIQILHSALSSPEKRAAYVSILKGEAQVVLGTRSAILTPFDFDVVILDEEHDSSFKQQDPSPRYHTRELAFHIAHKYGALVVLGSATPSIETFYNAEQKNLQFIELKQRATAAELPKVEIIDMVKVRQQRGILMAPELRESLTEAIANGEQAIVLMNRRGYSKMRVCADCGETLYCKNCKVPLVYHKQHNALLCHYCNLLYPVNTPCLKCGKETFEYVGGAIEKLEEEIYEWVPHAKIVRMDRDSTQRVGASEKILEAFRNREYNILLGTQMVAKGHDFPGVKLVGIVGADSGLAALDFRSEERLFQLLSQTAGRAGRSQGGGRVLIQTFNPTAPIMQFALHHDFNGFAAREKENRALFDYPPFKKFVSLSLGSSDLTKLKKELSHLEKLCKKIPNVKVNGPVEAPIPFIQGVYWYKIFLKSDSLMQIRQALLPLVQNHKAIQSGVDLKIEIE